MEAIEHFLISYARSVIMKWSWLRCWALVVIYCCLLDVAATSAATNSTTNATNSTVSLLDAEAHWKVNDSCSNVRDIPVNRQCTFVRNVTDCEPEGGLINYLEFTYCWMPDNLVPLSSVIMVSYIACDALKPFNCANL